MTQLRVVVAPDSYKGTADAEQAAAALATGWRRVRPEDDLVVLPQADGGEGTARILADVLPDAKWIEARGINGPDGRFVDSGFALTADGTAIVDLASASGIALMTRLDPLNASTVGLGELLRLAVESGAQKIVVGLGGSASTDGGLGALCSLGARALDRSGRPVRRGGGALESLAEIDCSGMVPPPPGGVELLADVNVPLLGQGGAARVFGPQKGADPREVLRLEGGLARLAGILGGLPMAAGAGAAGGTGYGLATCWGARSVPGASRVAELTGLDRQVSVADVLILGEGKLDATSLAGKVVHHALNISAGVAHRFIVAGQVELATGIVNAEVLSLSELAGSREAAISRPLVYLADAGALLAQRLLNAIEGDKAVAFL